jgi:basic amino acid/polyamine antiporter, APA family
MESPQPQVIRPQLSLWDAVSIIIGIVIGAGIYETTPLIFQQVSGPGVALGVWALGGLLSLIGALCYAELATAYPQSGGDYVYLTRAYGPWMGFLFGWAQLVVIRTGNIGLMAYVFADYAVRLWNFGQEAALIYALGSVSILSFVNILGIVFGKGTQNLLTLAKVLGLGGILIAGFLAPQTSGQATTGAGSQSGSIGLAMVFVLYTYGGWNDAALVAAEQRNRRRNITLALVIGTSAITLIYLLVNLAYLRGLGFEGVRASRAVAADVLERYFGSNGSRIMCLLVMISALGAMNGMILTGSRVYSAMGADYELFAWLGKWHPRLGSPLWSILTQFALVMAMILSVSTQTGREWINIFFLTIGLEQVEWTGHGGFDTLLRCTAPAFWLFFLLTGLSLFVLRERDQGIERPFTVPCYPLLPLLFCDTCAYMLFSATNYAGKLSLPVIALLHLGVVIYWFSKKPRPSAV